MEKSNLFNLDDHDIRYFFKNEILEEYFGPKIAFALSLSGAGQDLCRYHPMAYETFIFFVWL